MSSSWGKRRLGCSSSATRGVVENGQGIGRTTQTSGRHSFASSAAPPLPMKACFSFQLKTTGRNTVWQAFVQNRTSQSIITLKRCAISTSMKIMNTKLSSSSRWSERWSLIATYSLFQFSSRAIGWGVTDLRMRERSFSHANSTLCWWSGKVSLSRQTLESASCRVCSSMMSI